MNDGLNKVRITLINTGKIIPFVVCGIVLVSYSECLCALMIKDFLVYENSLVLNKPISWFLGSIFEYNIQFMFVITILSFAIHTCIFNKLSLLYLYVNLIEKSYFPTIELYEEYIYAIVILNIAISGFLLYKGIKQIK